MRVQNIAICAIVILATVYPAFSQSLVIVNTNTRSFPTVSAKVYSFDPTGAIQNITKGDVSVSDQGQSVDHEVTCDPPTSGRSISLVVMCDVSSTSGVGSPSTIDLAKAGALVIPKIVSATSDEIALATFDQNSTLLYGLSTSKSKYESSIIGITKGNGTNLGSGLLSSPLGGLVHLQNAQNQRALIVFLNAQTSVNVLSVLAQAKTYRIPIYVIGLRSKITDDVKRIADSTGGAWTENVTTVAEVETFAKAFAAHAKNLPGCTVTWKSLSPCSEVHQISIARGSSVRTTTAFAPTSLISGLQYSSAGIEFGESGVPIEKNVSLTARNADVTITSAVISQGPFFLVTPIAAGTVIKKDESLSITVRYTPQNKRGVYGTLSFATNTCNVQPLYFHGGELKSGETVKITAPKQGTTLLAGRAVDIEWTNTLPTDLVRIDVSYDNGKNWRSVTESTSGHRYKWLVGPIISSEVRFRVQRTLIDSSNIVVFEGNPQPVYDAAFVNDNASVILGGHDGTVRQYNRNTGEQVRLLGTHSNWVWSIATHPTQPLVASGSHDASVRIWNYSTGERIATIPSGARVWCVEFSPDGQSLIVGSERSFTIYNINDLQNGYTVALSEGPVYNAKYSASGNKFIVTHGKVATIYNAATKEELKSLVGHAEVIYTAALSSDGSQAATGGADFTLKTWNAVTGSQTQSVTPAVGSVLATQFSPDNSKILASGVDGVTKVYETATLKLLNTFSGHQGVIYGTKFSRNGKSFITASTDYTARAWNIEGATLVEDTTTFTLTNTSGTPSGSSVNFGTVSIGKGANLTTDIILNSSTDSLTVLSARIVTGDVSDFDVTAPFTPVTLPPDGKLNVDLNFSPTTGGQRSAKLEVETGVGVVSVQLSGNGAARELDYPNVVNFGRHIALQSIVDTVIFLKRPNSFASPLTISTVVIRGVQSNQFSMIGVNVPVTIQPDGQTQLKLRFQPLDLGKFSAVIELTYSNGQTDLIKLYGEGTGDASVSFSSTGVLFVTDKCNAVASKESVKLKNSGNSSLLIYAAVIDGANANEFSLSGLGAFPLEVAPLSERVVEITFTPQNAGVKDARLVISSNAINADNGSSTIPLIARKDSVGFELTRPKVAFSNIAEGESAVERLLLYNNGTVGLRWSRLPIDLGQFRIESIIPDVTNPGGYSEITVRFKGGVVGTPYTAQYTFLDSTCNRSQELLLTATVRSYIGCTVKAANTSGRTGSVSNVPVYVTNKVNFDRTNVTTIQARIAVNGTLLTPTSDKGTLGTDGMRRFTVSIPIPTTDSLATTLQFNTTWGNDTASVVRFDSVWTTDTIVVRTQDGSVLIEDICKQGGPRLINLKANAAAIRFSPQPSTGESMAEISILERGLTKITMVDINGRVVMTIAEQHFDPGTYSLPVSTFGLENSLYFVVMQTPTQRISTRFEVVR